MDASGWDDRYRTTDRLWSVEPNVFVADRLGGMDPGVGLDLASGEGRNAIWLAERGWDMTAVDFSEVACERGRRHSDAVDFVVADLLAWEPERRFDLIVIAYLHLVDEELAPLIRRAVTWLMPGGEIFMVGHDRSNIERGVGGPQYPEVLWDVDQLIPLLEGLEILEAGVVERAVEMDDGVAMARDTLVRARAHPG
jgi:SAM-dependent methyltransferase